MTKSSKYNSTRDLKITYLLGAGASYYAVPILEKQGRSMINVARQIRTEISVLKYKQEFKELYNSQKILDLTYNFEDFGKKALEFGSIDIYARRLYLLGGSDDLIELTKLKYHLSVYFDIWEMFLAKGMLRTEKENMYYVRIDKRYISLLSVLLEKTDSNPVLNNNVSFISWNYDLQLESAYRSFLKKGNNSIKDIDSSFNFMNEEVNKRKIDVIHLNGFRGFFKHNNTDYENVELSYQDTLLNYLKGFLDNEKQFKFNEIDHSKSIKYAWESDSYSFKRASKIMKNTDALVVIGYSFPSFNRNIDSRLIEEFKSKEGVKIIYQNPEPNSDLVDSIFNNIPSESILVNKDVKQFHIPHEFLFPSDSAEIFF